jgi:regulator of RNase E activity RraA
LPAGAEAAKRLAGTSEVGVTELSSATREALLRVGTSTLTGILSRRGLRNMFLQDVWPIRPVMARMIGPAFTMHFIPAHEDKTATGRRPVQRAMEKCPPGHVLVVDSRGDPRAASAGDIYCGRLRARGCAGIVTDGGLRDRRRSKKQDVELSQFAPKQPLVAGNRNGERCRGTRRPADPT